MIIKRWKRYSRQPDWPKVQSSPQDVSRKGQVLVRMQVSESWRYDQNLQSESAWQSRRQAMLPGDSSMTSTRAPSHLPGMKHWRSGQVASPEMQSSQLLVLKSLQLSKMRQVVVSE